MRETLKVGTWAKVSDDCPMRFWIDDGCVDLLMGESHDGFEVVFSVTALERFLALATEALVRARVDAGVRARVIAGHPAAG